MAPSEHINIYYCTTFEIPSPTLGSHMEKPEKVLVTLKNGRTGEVVQEEYSSLEDFRTFRPKHADGRDAIYSLLPLTARVSEWRIEVTLFYPNGKKVTVEDPRPYAEDVMAS